MVRFTELYEGFNKRYEMREITINPQYVVAIREDSLMRNALYENKLPEGLNTSSRFTRIILNSGQGNLDVTVAGAPEIVEQKILNAKRVLLG